MSLAATIDAMIAAGCTPEQIGAVARAHEAGTEAITAAKRAKAAERKARWRAEQTAKVPKSPGDNVGHDGTRRDKERPHTPKETSPYSPPKGGSLPPPGGASKPDPKQILAEVLSVDTVADLMAHRKALRAPVTTGAAKGLVQAFTKFGDPEAAAAAMMANGWKGFQPEWMRNARAGPAVPRRHGHLEAHENHLSQFHEPDRSTQDEPDVDSSAPRLRFAGEHVGGHAEPPGAQGHELVLADDRYAGRRAAGADVLSIGDLASCLTRRRA